MCRTPTFAWYYAMEPSSYILFSQKILSSMKLLIGLLGLLGAVIVILTLRSHFIGFLAAFAGWRRHACMHAAGVTYHRDWYEVLYISPSPFSFSLLFLHRSLTGSYARQCTASCGFRLKLYFVPLCCTVSFCRSFSRFSPPAAGRPSTSIGSSIWWE